MKGFTSTLLILASFASQSAFAVERELINDALNKALMEHASVEKGYEENPAAERPASQSRRHSGRIEIVIDSEISGSGSALASDVDSSNVYREKRVQVKLDKELKAIDKDVAKETKAENTKKN